jgi:hypothetical protein
VHLFVPGLKGLCIHTPVSFVTFTALPSVQRLVCEQLKSAKVICRTESKSRQALCIPDTHTALLCRLEEPTLCC